MNDDDLHAVRTLVSPRLDGPAPSWDAVAARRQRPARRPGWANRVAIPVAAAAVVLAVAAGVAVALRPAGSGAVAPGASSTPSLKEPRPNGGPASSGAVAALEALAGPAASVVPAALAPGQLIYVRSTGWQALVGMVEHHVHEMWVDPEGMIGLKIVVNGEDWTAPGPKSNNAAEVAEARQHLAAYGPGIHMPTPAWLASLPTDPDQLLAALRAMTETGSRWSPDHQVFDSLSNLFWHAGPVLPTDLRVALYRALAKLTGLTAENVTVDGRDLVALRHAEANDSSEILFDRATGHAVGTRSIRTGEWPPTPPVVPGDDQTVEYLDLWTYAIVDEVGQT
jgi:hypothetical protein